MCRISIIVDQPNNIILLLFFNDTATTEIYPLSLHDALPISIVPGGFPQGACRLYPHGRGALPQARPPLSDPRVMRLDHAEDRKSTRLNSSHGYSSYAVFCLKKKKRIPHPSLS